MSSDTHPNTIETMAEAIQSLDSVQEAKMAYVRTLSTLYRESGKMVEKYPDVFKTNPPRLSDPAELRHENIIPESNNPNRDGRPLFEKYGIAIESSDVERMNHLYQATVDAKGTLNLAIKQGAIEMGLLQKEGA